MQLLKKYWLHILLGIAVLGVILFEASGNGDFNIYLSASHDLLEHKNIYQIYYNEWFHYYYDVLFALILAPFSFLPVYWVKVGWLLLNVFFVYRIWKIITSWLTLETLTNKARIALTVISFVFALRFLRDNFHLAQVTIFILYTILEGLKLIFSGKKACGALLLAFGITVKLLPLVIIPYLLYRKEWRAAVFTIAFVVIILIVPAVFVGWEYNTFLLTERWHSINPNNKIHVLDTDERSFHSLSSLLATLLVENCGDENHVLQIKRNIADISIDKLNMIINIFRLFFVGCTLFFLRTRPFVKSPSNLQTLYELGYICTIIPLIFPHQQHYAFFFMFPAAVYLFYFLINNYYTNPKTLDTTGLKKRNRLVAYLSIVFLLTSSHFILGTFNDYYDHFKTLTYGVIFFLFVLFFNSPDKLEATK